MKQQRVILSNKQLKTYMTDVKHLLSSKPVSIGKAERAITKLAIINACAYKRIYLTKAMSGFNLYIYQFKSRYLRIAVERYMELDGDVGHRNGIFYFRRRDGVQISFHNRLNKNSVRHFKKLNELSKILPTREWDGILDSYIYTGKRYAELLKKRKKAGKTSLN